MGEGLTGCYGDRILLAAGVVTRGGGLAAVLSRSTPVARANAVGAVVTLALCTAAGAEQNMFFGG